MCLRPCWRLMCPLSRMGLCFVNSRVCGSQLPSAERTPGHFSHSQAFLISSFLHTLLMDWPSEVIPMILGCRVRINYDNNCPDSYHYDCKLCSTPGKRGISVHSDQCCRSLHNWERAAPPVRTVGALPLTFKY